MINDIQEDFIETLDKNEFHEVKQLGESIFYKATSEKRIIYLMGNTIVFDVNPEDTITIKKTDKYLTDLNTRLLIPIFAAVVDTIEKQKQLIKQRN